MNAPRTRRQAQPDRNQVGRGCARADFLRAGALAPGGAELACPSRKISAARATTLRPRRGLRCGVMALAADVHCDADAGSAPPPPADESARAQPRSTLILGGSAAGAARYEFPTS